MRSPIPAPHQPPRYPTNPDDPAPPAPELDAGRCCQPAPTDDSGFTVVTAAIPTRDFSVNADTWKYTFNNLDTIEQTLVCYG